MSVVSRRPWNISAEALVADKLPGVLCRSEVVNIVYEQISPLANALTEIDRATKTLKSMSAGDVE